VLKWAFEHGRTWGEEVFKEAVKDGAEKLLRWIHENGHPIDFKQLAELAIKANQAGLVKWCLNERVRLDEESCTLAVKKGSLKVLKLLRKENIPWDTDVLRKAVKKRKNAILDWLLIRECMFCGRFQDKQRYEKHDKDDEKNDAGEDEEDGDD